MSQECYLSVQRIHCSAQKGFKKDRLNITLTNTEASESWPVLSPKAFPDEVAILQLAGKPTVLVPGDHPVN